MEKSKNFTYQETVQVVEEKPTAHGRYGINCKVCNVTCHSSCSLAKDGDILGCSSMNKDGYCKRCPKKCQWLKHESKPFKLAFKTVNVQRTLEDLKRNYEEAMGKKMTAEQMVAECTKRIEDVKKEALQNVAKAKRYVMFFFFNFILKSNFLNLKNSPPRPPACQANMLSITPT